MHHRLYLLGQSALRDARQLTTPPAAGDIVCYLRLAQDPTGVAADALRTTGVLVLPANELFSADIETAVDQLGERFLRQWAIVDGCDISQIRDVSTAALFAMEIARQTNPRVQVHFGEVLRRLISAHPDATRILTDVADGDGVFSVEPGHLPLRRVLAHVAANAGLPFEALAPVNPVPYAMKRLRHQRWLPILRYLIGGLRPEWLRRYRAFKRNARADGRSILYMFLGREQDRIARRLAKGGRFHVVCDSAGIPGTDAVRCDQMIALPALRDLRAARALIRRLASLSQDGGGRGRFALGGVDYGPILYDSVRAVMELQMAPMLMMLAQARRLQRLVGFDALFVNGGGIEPMGALIALNRSSGKTVYLMPHGMDLQRFAYPMMAADNAHVTYLAYGSDHADYFRSYPDSPARRSVLVGNPLTTAMNEFRRLRPTSHGKRLLILSFGHLEFWNAGRIYACDGYYFDLFTVARDLVGEGWSVSVRSHPYHPRNLEVLIATELGIEGCTAWDEHATLEEALLAHDVVISNLSTAYYQSLYAGWPTIFFEPDRSGGGMDALVSDDMFTGLVVAEDIERPVTNDPATLARMVRETLDPSSMSSTFPHKFVTQYSRRFVGPNPEHADVEVAAFIEADLFAGDDADAV